MDATISAHLGQIAKELNALGILQAPIYLQPDFLGAALGSFIAVIVAVSGWLYATKFAHRTKLEIRQIESYVQPGTIYYRLAIANKGSHIARNVEVYTESIKDNDVPRANFLACPFEWTHSIAGTEQTITRDINPNQTVRLDFLRYYIGYSKGDGTRERLWLNLPGIDINDYAIIKPGISVLRFDIYQGSGQTIKVAIRISWEDYEKEPVFEILNKLT